MKKLVSFVHVSLDGFAATPDHKIDWIKIDDEMFDFVNNITNKADTALYGRVTFDMMDSYWPTAGDKPNASKHDIDHALWYKKVTKIVVSKTRKEAKLSNTKFISKNIAQEIEKLKEDKSSKKDILMLGSPSLTRLLMENDLIDQYWTFVNPVILGSGLSMFSHFDRKQNLKLLETKVFSCGAVALKYERQRK